MTRYSIRDRTQRICEAVQWMNDMHVYVGIPEGESGSGGEGMSNVQLAYLHTNGSPVNHIPARPFLEPAIEQSDVKDRIGDIFGEAYDIALEGDFTGAEAMLERAGIVGENAVKAYIGSGNLAANAPITIDGGWMRNHVSGKPVHVKGKHSSAPLIDTGSLRASITHIVTDEKL